MREALNVSVSITDFIADYAKSLDYAATGSFGISTFVFFYLLMMRLFREDMNKLLQKHNRALLLNLYLLTFALNVRMK